MPPARIRLLWFVGSEIPGGDEDDDDRHPTRWTGREGIQHTFSMLRYCDSVACLSSCIVSPRLQVHKRDCSDAFYQHGNATKEKVLKGACYLHVLCVFANDAVCWYHREEMWKGKDHPMKGAECRQRTMSPFQTSSCTKSHRCYSGQTSRAHQA